MAGTRRKLTLAALDILAVLAAYIAAFLLRYDFHFPPGAVHRLLWAAPSMALAFAAACSIFSLYRGLRFFAGLPEVLDLLKAGTCAAALQAGLVLLLRDHGFPRSVLVSGPMLAVFFTAGLRSFARGASHYFYVHLLGGRRRAAVVIGVGDAAELVYQSMRSDQSVDYQIVAFVHDDPADGGMRLHGVRVVPLSALLGILQTEQVDEVVIAVDRHQRGALLDSVADAMQKLVKRPSVFVAPSLDEMLKTPSRKERRKVTPADLLNRRVIPLDTARIGRAIQGKVVLVTGAGGTIGGELARQVARYKPSKLVLLENNATALFYCEAELRDTHPDLAIVPALGDVRDQALLQRVFLGAKPQVVFHAAAHKHVPQLEVNVCEGVSNNLVGTYRLATAADRAGVETFVLISTDKAVRPTSVMGATKRGAELVVSNLARSSKTRFAAVRFGNVLGSSGSVLKIFQEQIENGQPLTLTHPEMSRYFMTVEEAVGLVLQASTLTKGGEIFVLNMGQQVKIMDMARRLIWLSGLEPDLDVAIRLVGLRPGEKIAEEIVEDPSGQEQSEHPEIMVLRAESARIDSLTEKILVLEQLGLKDEKNAVLRALGQLVPSFSGAGAGDQAAGNDGVRVTPGGDYPHADSVSQT